MTSQSSFNKARQPEDRLAEETDLQKPTTSAAYANQYPANGQDPMAVYD